jgi:Ca2+-binding RTX toxin-like protein
MANFTYLIPPFTTTTFTSPVVGTDDVIRAVAAFDFTINGNGGNDSVTTGTGNDTITTGSGQDVIKAGDGNNTVNAGDGENNVTAGRGNDTITTGSGNDTILAGGGNNTVNAGDGNNAVVTSSGNDTITTGAGADIVSSGGGNDLITTGAGNDIIRAGAGDDTVNAGTGNDQITPGGGADSLIGGGGHDTFVYNRLSEAMTGADTISDFDTSNPRAMGEGDVLDLRFLVDDFTGLAGSTLANLVASGHLDFSAGGGGTVISFDSNGSAAGGSLGTLVTLLGVGFTTEADSLISFADNIMV